MHDLVEFEQVDKVGLGERVKLLVGGVFWCARTVRFLSGLVWKVVGGPSKLAVYALRIGVVRLLGIVGGR